MTHKSDVRLLREYADHGDEVAFTELVSRHRDLVYSAAARQTSSPDLAGDVAQNVFTSLARCAPDLAARLAPEGSLAGWLCRSTRNVVLNLRRGEFRRHTRERKAMEEYLAPEGQPPEWEHLRRVLDEAMAELGETDHEALVLRFFQNRDFRAVGQALGLSDDSAQKRVSRALDKLRDRLSRRGLTTTATALALALLAHAIQAAPAGFIITLPTAATLAAAAAGGAKLGATFHLLAMRTLQKGMVATALVAALGAGLFEARQAARLQTENRALIGRQAGLARDLELTRQAHDAAVARANSLNDERAALSADAIELLRLRGEVARLRAESQSAAAFRSAGASINDTAKAWVQRVAQLQAYVKEHPEEGIPELQYLTDREWLVTVDADLDTPLFGKAQDFRHAIDNLRRQAESRFGNWTLTPALQKYAAANAGAFPTDLGQLTPYLKPDDAALIMDLYEIRPSSVFSPELMKEFKLKTDWVITRKRPFSNSRSRLAFFLTGHAYWQAPEGQ